MSKSNKKSSSQKSKQSKSQPNNKMWLGIGIAVIVVLIGLAAFGLFKPGADQTQQVASLPMEISVDEAYDKYQDGVFLLDVRQPEEWIEYHAPDTTLIPLDQLEARLDELPQDQEIVVVCRSGNRSQVGRDILLNAGFDQVTSMAGGLSSWRDAGYPITSGQ